MSQRFQRGDILLIRFPFTDLSGSKRRPIDNALLSALGIDLQPFLQAEYQKLADLLESEGETALLATIQARA